MEDGPQDMHPTLVEQFEDRLETDVVAVDPTVVVWSGGGVEGLIDF